MKKREYIKAVQTIIDYDKTEAIPQHENKWRQLAIDLIMDAVRDKFQHHTFHMIESADLIGKGLQVRYIDKSHDINSIADCYKLIVDESEKYCLDDE